MINGLRAWCIHRSTGRVIHLGGQFTCGDAHRMAALLEQLIEGGTLPRDGDFGGGVKATYVFVADGMPWIADLLISKLPAAVPILDFYHAVDRLAEHGRTHMNGPRQFLEQAKRHLLGSPRPSNSRQPQFRRRGHKKLRRHDQPVPSAPRPPLPTDRKGSGQELIEWLEQMADDSEEHGKLIEYFKSNKDRIDYARYRHHGYQIGSGAMKSLHTSGSQMRMKLAGATWLPETIDALLKVRMLRLSGRWDEFFGQDKLWQSLGGEFRDVPYHTLRGHPVAA